MGKFGQFDVLVDETLVASKGKGVLGRIFSKEFPDETEAVEAVRARLDG